MRHNTIVPAVAAVLLAAAALPAAAQQKPESYKIGYVNTARVIHESQTTQKARRVVEDNFQKRTREIDAGPKDQIKRRRLALDQEMNIEREDSLRQFVDRTNRIIRGVAVAEKLDAVFLEAAYFNTRIDITDKVIKALDSER